MTVYTMVILLFVGYLTLMVVGVCVATMVDRYKATK